MAKPASIADLKSQKATQVDLFSGDIESAKRSEVVLLNLIDDQSQRALPGVDSFVLFDMEDHGIEDTKTDGTKQSDLSGGTKPTTLAINAFKTVPGYFKYVFGEHSRLNWVQEFVSNAPEVAILDVEKAAIAALRGIGAVNYRQLSGSSADGTANQVPDVDDMKYAITLLTKTKKLKKMNLRAIGDTGMSIELPNIFGLYDKEASSELGDLAKTKGYIREVLGVPFFESQEMAAAEFIVFERRAVAYAIRTMAELRFQAIASESQDYYGINISYGVVARQDNRAVVMQAGAAYAA